MLDRPARLSMKNYGEIVSFRCIPMHQLVTRIYLYDRPEVISLNFPHHKCFANCGGIIMSVSPEVRLSP